VNRCSFGLVSSFAVVVWAVTATGMGAQTPPVTELQPEVTLAEPYSLIRGLVELPGGDVMIADQREGALYLASFDGRKRQLLGGRGQGPHEYASLVGLFAGPADTAYAYDLKNMRIAVATPGGVAFVTAFRELGAEGVHPHFEDSRRRLYWDNRTHTRLLKKSEPGSADAHRTVVMRTDGSGGIDTVATLETPGPANPGPLPDWDHWAGGADGRLAIVRDQGEYRVDWVTPNASMVRGPVIDEERIKLSRADRDSLSHTRTAGVNLGGAASRARSDVYLPDRFPYAKMILVSSVGRAWVQRWLPVDEDRPLFDVFDTQGRRVARYRLPPGRILIGLGRGTLYATHEDAVGLQWVERYRVP